MDFRHIFKNASVTTLEYDADLVAEAMRILFDADWSVRRLLEDVEEEMIAQDRAMQHILLLLLLALSHISSLLSSLFCHVEKNLTVLKRPCLFFYRTGPPSFIAP